MENKHITQEILYQYHHNQLSSTDTITFLDHVSQCTYCADKLAASFEQEMLIAAPRNLKERVLIEAERTKSAPAKKQFFFYSLRVCTAMCGALFLLFTSFTSSALPDLETQTNSVSSSFFEEVDSSLNNITQQINEKMNSFVKNQQFKNGGNYNDTTKK